MNLEQRLQHAARDLREVPVTVPPLGRLTRGRPRVHTMATPVLVPLLFVAGALFAIGATLAGAEGSLQNDLPAIGDSVDPSPAATPVEARHDPELRIAHAPSAPVELRMIAEFVSSAQSAKPPAAPVENPVRATRSWGSHANVIDAI